MPAGARSSARPRSSEPPARRRTARGTRAARGAPRVTRTTGRRRPQATSDAARPADGWERPTVRSRRAPRPQDLRQGAGRHRHRAASRCARRHRPAGGTPPRASGSDLFERRLRLLGDGAEGLRVAYGEIREHLAVELDPCRLQDGDELVVREAVRARAGVDPHDPESPEGPLLVLAVTVGVGERVLDLLLRVAVRGLLQPPVALRLGENLAALLARVDGSLDARHLLP